MRTTKRQKWILLLLFTCYFCIQNSLAQSTSAIGLRVQFSAPMGPIEYADKVYLIKLDENTSILESQTVTWSNIQKDNQIYITDVEPGRYAIVAVGKGKILPLYNLAILSTFFSEELIKASIITVEENDFVYMGDYRLKTKMMCSNKKADNAQRYFFKMLTNEKKIPGYMRQVFQSYWYYKSDIEDLEFNKDMENEFMKKALIHFSNTNMEEIIRRKIDV